MEGHGSNDAKRSWAVFSCDGGNTGLLAGQIGVGRQTMSGENDSVEVKVEALRQCVDELNFRLKELSDMCNLQVEAHVELMNYVNTPRIEVSVKKVLL